MDEFEVFCRQAFLPASTPSPGRCGPGLGGRPKDSSPYGRRSPRRPPVEGIPEVREQEHGTSIQTVAICEQPPRDSREGTEAELPGGRGVLPVLTEPQDSQESPEHVERTPRAAAPHRDVCGSEEDLGRRLGEEDGLSALRSRARSPRLGVGAEEPSSALAVSPRPRMSRALRRGSVPDGLLGGGVGLLDPAAGDLEAMYRVRNFTRGRKGLLVNHGDTYRSRTGLPESRSPGGPGVGLGRRRHSELSGVENLNSLLPLYEQALASSRADSEASGLSSIGEPEPESYTVALLGGPGVGKTTLAKQFTTSEDLAAHDDEDEEEEEEHDEENGDQTGGQTGVSVLVDGEEHWVSLIDTAGLEYDAVPDADAYMVVFSVSDKKSLDVAREILRHLSEDELFCHLPVILVANKEDIVRKRVVSSAEGKDLAVRYECKYRETSACLNHGVDQLLVGVVSQIKLRAQVTGSSKTRGKSGEDGRSLTRVFGKLFNNRRRKSLLRSCDNLFVK